MKLLRTSRNKLETLKKDLIIPVKNKTLQHIFAFRNWATDKLSAVATPTGKQNMKQTGARFSGAFAKLRKATISFVFSVYHSVRSHWADFDET
jgi:hypothetical protein